MAETDFYLYLPSTVKSSSFYNKINRYSTVLPTPIWLNEGFDYECCLYSIIYPRTAANVYWGKFQYYSFEKNEKAYGVIPTGIYILPTEFIEAFKKEIGPEDSKYYILSADATTKRFHMDCTNTECEMEFSKNLAELTGFQHKIEGKGSFTSFPYNESGGITSLFLYSNIVANTVVGDVNAPILAAVKYVGSGPEAVTQYEPKNLVYSQVSKRIIDNVTIELKLKDGTPVPFIAGDVIVLLHIRAKMPRLS